AGNYSVTVTDANGCVNTTSVTITEPTILQTSTSGTNVDCNGNANGTPSVLASSISSSTDALCNGSADGTASVLSNGGTPAFSYNWTPIGGTGATAANLPAGSYTVTTTDANGCTATASVTINEPTPVALNTSSTNANCGSANGTASVVASGG